MPIYFGMTPVTLMVTKNFIQIGHMAIKKIKTKIPIYFDVTPITLMVTKNFTSSLVNSL
jgi:hypothetical protein